MVSGTELYGGLFELESLVEDLEGIGFFVIAGCFKDGVSFVVGEGIGDDDVVVFEEALGVCDARVGVVFHGELYGSFWSGEDACGGVLANGDDVKAYVLSLGLSSDVFFVDFYKIVSGFEVGESYAFEGGGVSPVKEADDEFDFFSECGVIKI